MTSMCHYGAFKVLTRVKTLLTLWLPG